MRLSLTFLPMYIFHIRCQFSKPEIQCPVLFRTFQHVMSALAARKRKKHHNKCMCLENSETTAQSPLTRKKVRRRPDEFGNYSNAPQLSLVEKTLRPVLKFFLPPTTCCPRIGWASWVRLLLYPLGEESLFLSSHPGFEDSRCWRSSSLWKLCLLTVTGRGRRREKRQGVAKGACFCSSQGSSLTCKFES